MVEGRRHFLTHCPRCGKGHTDLHIKAFKNRPDNIYDGYSTCPNTGEPILFRPYKIKWCWDVPVAVPEWALFKDRFGWLTSDDLALAD